MGRLSPINLVWLLSNRPKSTRKYLFDKINIGFHTSNTFKGHSKTTMIRFWSLLTTYQPLVDIFFRNFITFMKGSLYVVDISLTTYLPHHVNIVFECPLTSLYTQFNTQSLGEKFISHIACLKLKYVFSSFNPYSDIPFRLSNQRV